MTSPIDQANEMLSLARGGLPAPLRWSVSWKVKRITVKLTPERLCKAGRLLEAAIAFGAAWTDNEVDDAVADRLHLVLSAVGCR